MRTLPISVCLTASLAGAAVGRAQVYDLRADWSDASNPNGAWPLRAGSALLPPVAAWQVVLGGWTSPQPGWADSADGTNRLPFWFRSNGTEVFTNDWQAGDVVVHSKDDANGVGNGPARAVWTAPAAGRATVSGGVWWGRDIGRSNHWTLLVNQTALSDGEVAGGGPYTRAAPFLYSAGSGGAGMVQNIAVGAGDSIVLEIDRSSTYGDFVGVNLVVTFTLSCYPNCDGSTIAPVLNVADFACFLNKFAAGDSYANCDHSTTPPVLNVQDFSCFLNKFAAGCS